MRPPYKINDKILRLVVSISERLGEVNAIHLDKPPTALRKKNRIKTIQSSLEIEGNTLSEEQITALLNNERVIAPAKDVLEVQNAIKVYDRIRNYNANSLTDLQKAHGVLMDGLISDAGKFRSKNVGIVKGSQVAHLAPGGNMVKGLLKDLFTYLKNDKEVLLIKSCVFHYEFEFIHPFIDGNGRMGRLWQTVLLMQQYPVFEYLPVESLIKENQKEYYKALGVSDKLGHSTPFIEFMLSIINQSLNRLLSTQNRSMSLEERIEMYKDVIGEAEFSRKDYLLCYRQISQATASRDLKWAVDMYILERFGDKRNTKYKYVV